MTKTAGLSVLVTLLIFHTNVRGEDTSAEAFGRSVVRANVNLRNAGFDFGKQLGPVLAGDPGNVALLATTYAKLVKTLSQVKGEMGNLKYPNSQEAKDLYAAHQAFLQGQTSMIEGDLADVLIIAVDPQKDADAKKEEIEKLLDVMTQREKADGAKLLPSLQAYVDAYDLDVSAWLDE